MTSPVKATLLPGEEIKAVADPPMGGAGTATDEQINDRYIRGEVRIVVEQARYQLKQIPTLVASSDYDLQPSFQRRPRWSRVKQSRLIESFIINVPVPPVFLYESELSRYEVMDGKQRLTAIEEFYADRFPLEGLREWSELNGRKYSTLPEQIRRGIDRRYLSSIVLLHETGKSEAQAEELKQLVFERINTGGEDLSDQETRNALHSGPFNSLCIELSRYPSFCQLWQIPQPDADELSKNPDWLPSRELSDNSMYRTMEDVQTVLRFFAHRQRDKLWKGGSNLDSYLTSYLVAANRFSPEVLVGLKSVFQKTMDTIVEVLDEYAFLPYRKRGDDWYYLAKPSFVLYEPLSFAFSQLLGYRSELYANRSLIMDRLPQFYIENASAFDGRKVNSSDVRERDRLALDFLSGFVS
ncbi:DUF262 domain-containing protein [Nocardia sp. NPDC051750]|uniref:DUF262 domain-containing protein n=1 Tax=Nocardia sp. NPDC051750 TaxID=3364325 RepID=UPI00378C82C9